MICLVLGRRDQPKRRVTAPGRVSVVHPLPWFGVFLPVNRVVTNHRAELSAGLGQHRRVPQAPERKGGRALDVQVRELWHEPERRHCGHVLGQKLESQHALQKLVRAIDHSTRPALDAVGNTASTLAGLQTKTLGSLRRVELHGDLQMHRRA